MSGDDDFSMLLGIAIGIVITSGFLLLVSKGDITHDVGHTQRVCLTIENDGKGGETRACVTGQEIIDWQRQVRKGK